MRLQEEEIESMNNSQEEEAGRETSSRDNMWLNPVTGDLEDHSPDSGSATDEEQGASAASVQNTYSLVQRVIKLWNILNLFVLKMYLFLGKSAASTNQRKSSKSRIGSAKEETRRCCKFWRKPSQEAESNA